MKREASDQTKWNKYLREKKWYGYFELKHVREKTFPFSDMEEGQREGLPAAEANGLVWKFSDDDRRVKPCDCISAPPLPAYLVLRWGNTAYAIRIERILEMKQKGITEEEAREIAEKIVIF